MKKTFTKLLMLLGVFLFLGAGNASALCLMTKSNNNFSNYDVQFTENNNQYELALPDGFPANEEFKLEDWGTWWGCQSGQGDITDKINTGSGSSTAISLNSAKDAGNFIVTKAFTDVHIYVDKDKKNMYITGKEVSNDPEKNGVWLKVGNQSLQFTQFISDQNRFYLIANLPTTGYGGSNFYIEDNGSHKYSKDGNNTAITLNQVKELNTTAKNDELWLSNVPTEGKWVYMVYYRKYGDGSALIVSEASDLYVYGHLSNKYWIADNRVKMVSKHPDNFELDKEEGPGIFWAHKVDISGRWSLSDRNIDSSRTDLGDTKDESYVGFFFAPAYFEDSNDLESTKYPEYKLGSDDYHNVDVYQPLSGNKHDNITTANPEGEDTRVYSKENYQQRNTSIVEQAVSHNFKVGEGLYHIKVDLNKGYVRFYRLQPEEVNVKIPTEYVWFTGEDEYKKNNGKVEQVSFATELNNEQVHFYSLDDQYKLQVGLNETENDNQKTDTEHRLACQVEYRVFFTKNAPSSSKRRAAAVGSEFNSAEDVKNAGYDEVTNNNEGNVYYTTEGSSSSQNNHLIVLNNNGYYVIEASLKDNPKYADAYERPADTYLAVHVEVATGVESIEVEAVEEGEAVYYNLQGVKVQNPDNGIFIKVVGNKAEKVVK